MGEDLRSASLPVGAETVAGHPAAFEQCGRLAGGQCRPPRHPHRSRADYTPTVLTSRGAQQPRVHTKPHLSRGRALHRLGGRDRSVPRVTDRGVWLEAGDSRPLWAVIASRGATRTCHGWSQRAGERVTKQIQDQGRTPVQEPESARSGQGQNRTADTAIFSRVLYQLSYLTPASTRVAPDRPVGRHRSRAGRTGVAGAGWPWERRRPVRGPAGYADLTGFEPATSTLTGWRALQAAPQVLAVVRSYAPERSS